MDRLNVFLIVINIVLLLYAVSGSYTAIADFHIQPTTVPSPTAIPTPTPTLPPPSFFSIPKIGVNAPIEAVGVDDEGRMLLPQDLGRVGWYSPGFRPGEKGNSVVAGHLDSASGTGAIFSNLWQLEPGDEMMVVDTVGYTYTYVVTEKEQYRYDEVPIALVFGKASISRLNLITCTGAWDPSTLNYTHRMVIYSEIKH